MIKPAPEHRRPQVDTATVEIFIDNRFLCLDGGLPDGQCTKIRVDLRAVDRWRKPVLRRNQLAPVDQSAMFQLVKNVEELASGETAEQ
jgi:hypothetical protein